MSQENGSTVPATTAPDNKTQRLIVHDDSEAGIMMDSARFDQAQRVASTLAYAALTPKHLKGSTPQESVANCFRVVNQAFRWGMDPFAVADETYVVAGRLGYQGKLVASVVNTRSNLASRLKYEYEGEGDGRTVTVIGRFANEDFDRTITLSVGQAKTSNEMWKKDPDQKLYYSAVAKWARRHCPEVILGVMTSDEVEKIAESTTIPQSAIRARLLTAGEMAITVRQLETGATTIEEIQDSIPNLDAGQLEKLKAVEVITPGEEEQREPIRLETHPGQ
jgi:hypothetical protein